MRVAPHERDCGALQRLALSTIHRRANELAPRLIRPDRDSPLGTLADQPLAHGVSVALGERVRAQHEVDKVQLARQPHEPVTRQTVVLKLLVARVSICCEPNTNHALDDEAHVHVELHGFAFQPLHHGVARHAVKLRKHVQQPVV